MTLKTWLPKDNKHDCFSLRLSGEFLKQRSNVCNSREWHIGPPCTRYHYPKPSTTHILTIRPHQHFHLPLWDPPFKMVFYQLHFIFWASTVFPSHEFIGNRSWQHPSAPQMANPKELLRVGFPYWIISASCRLCVKTYLLQKKERKADRERWRNFLLVTLQWSPWEQNIRTIKGKTQRAFCSGWSLSLILHCDPHKPKALWTIKLLWGFPLGFWPQLVSECS